MNTEIIDCLEIGDEIRVRYEDWFLNRHQEERQSPERIDVFRIERFTPLYAVISQPKDAAVFHRGFYYNEAFTRYFQYVSKDGLMEGSETNSYRTRTLTEETRLKLFRRYYERQQQQITREQMLESVKKFKWAELTDCELSFIYDFVNMKTGCS